MTGNGAASGNRAVGMVSFALANRVAAGDGGGATARVVLVADGRDGVEGLLGGEVGGDRETESAELVIGRVGAGATVAAFGGAAGTTVAGCTVGADAGDNVSSTRGATGREGAGSIGWVPGMERAAGTAEISDCAGLGDTGRRMDGSSRTGTTSDTARTGVIDGSIFAGAGCSTGSNGGTFGAGGRAGCGVGGRAAGNPGVSTPAAIC